MKNETKLNKVNNELFKGEMKDTVKYQYEVKLKVLNELGLESKYKIDNDVLSKDYYTMTIDDVVDNERYIHINGFNNNISKTLLDGYNNDICNSGIRKLIMELKINPTVFSLILEIGSEFYNNKEDEINIIDKANMLNYESGIDDVIKLFREIN